MLILKQNPPLVENLPPTSLLEGDCPSENDEYGETGCLTLRGFLTAKFCALPKQGSPKREYTEERLTKAPALSAPHNTCCCRIQLSSASVTGPHHVCLMMWVEI